MVYLPVASRLSSWAGESLASPFRALGPRPGTDREAAGRENLGPSAGPARLTLEGRKEESRSRRTAMERPTARARVRGQKIVAPEKGQRPLVPLGASAGPGSGAPPTSLLR